MKQGLILFLMAFAFAERLDARVIKLNSIPSGEDALKPRSLHLRNNIQGNVEIVDDVVWSLDVRVKGFNEFFEQNIVLHCGVALEDSTLDIQVFEKNPSSSPQAITKALVTADVILRGPGYLIMPGSKVFFRANSTGRLYLQNWSGYKGAIEEYEVPAAHRKVDISHPCYEDCTTACDALDHLCLPCERGYELDTRKSSQWGHAECKDINECRVGRHSCPANTVCDNTNGGYNCRCRMGFYGNGQKCQACKQCPSGWYEFWPCNATRDAVCRKCSPPCERYMYQVHPCGVGFDRKCDDILKELRPITASSMFKPDKRLSGSVLLTAAGLGKFIITDDRMHANAAETRLKFSKNEDRDATIWRTPFLKIDLKLSNVDVLPIFADTGSVIPEQDKFFAGFNGLGEIKKNYCRHPIADSYILTHEFYNDYKTAVTKDYCTLNRKSICPDEAGNGQVYAKRTHQPCGSGKISEFDDTKLYCSSYVNIELAFGVTKPMFDDAPVWKFRDKSCSHLFDACRDCRRNKCYKERASLSCNKQCDYVCKCYHSKHCAKTAVTCATGDLSEWTLKQEFRGTDLSTRFNCYLQRVVPEKLFSLSYRVRIANTKLSSGWIHVKERQIAKGKDVYGLGAFEIKYEKGKTLTDNVVITGYGLKGTDGAGYAFDLRNIKPLVQADFAGIEGKLKFMPTKPFTHTGHQWSDGSNCRILSFWKKYIGRIKPFEHKLKIEKTRKSGERFLYRVRNGGESSVNISFLNSEPLLDKFGKVARITKLNSTLKANASHWIIHLKGNISTCPAYYEITVIEKAATVLLLKQDILVLCPLTHFHVIAVVPKMTSLPAHKGRLFIVYFSNGKSVYETNIEKMEELYVGGRLEKAKNTVASGSFDLQMLSQFDPIIILTGVFITGLVTLLMLACLIKPSRKDKDKHKGRQEAALNLGEKGNVREQLEKEDKLQWRHIIPIVFLVAFRVAYSFLLTASFIIIVFTIVNKSELDAVQDFKEFIQLKVNQSNQIALALDLFRESEAKIMTDKAAFMECACDYHMGRIMRNMRDNMTALVQLHDLIAFDKVSETLIKLVGKRMSVLFTIYGKIQRYRSSVTRTLHQIESQLTQYAYRVYNNKHFEVARSFWGAWQDFKSLDFLNSFGSFDVVMYRYYKRVILDELIILKRRFKVNSILKRLAKPFYPLANALLAPYRAMKRKVKETVLRRINNIKNKILKGVQCIGNIDMRKWERHVDDYDEESKKRCLLKAANRFMEKIIDDTKTARNKSGRFVINSARNDASFDILQGDALEEAHERTEDKRIRTMRQLTEYYKASEETQVALRLLRSHAVVLVLVFDILLITYRNLKTYRFAFVMAAGYEKKNEYKRIGEKFGDEKSPNDRSAGRKMVDCVAKAISMFFSTFTLALKLIFTTILIPVVVIIIAVIVSFYLTIAFAYNGMNVDSLEKLGAFRFLSARLDLSYNVTKEALIEHAEYLNTFDIGMYVESLRVQTEEFRNTMKEFNVDEMIRLKRLHAELCDTEDQRACNIDFSRLMEKLQMNVKPCMFPVIKARMPDNIYDSAAYRRQLKHELKHYVDAFRKIFINSFYIIAGVIGTILLTVVMSKLIFKFLKKMGMIRLKERHIYHELPRILRQRSRDGL